MVDDIVISVSDLTKIYKLYNEPLDRFYEALNPLRKKYHKNFYALRGIGFDIKRGETIGIIGRNGSGKSTLLKIITGVLTQTSGTITVNGRISALLELGAGFNMEMTGIENIYFNGTILGYTKEEMNSKLQDIIGFADIGDYINQPVKTYSSGMFVRLAFALSINVDPDILIVDEALSVGDMFFQQRCYSKFNDFKERNKTILLVTHDMSSVLKYCDRVLVLDKGLKIQEGPAREMVDLYKKIMVSSEDLSFSENGNELEADGHNRQKNDESELVAIWKNQITINPNYTSYGNDRAEIIDFALFDEHNKISQVMLKGKNCIFRMRVRVKDTLINPIFALTIKDIKGTEICGTNSLFEMIDTKTINENETVEIRFSQRLDLQRGSYFVSLGVTGFEQGEFVVYHRLYDIFGFEIISEKNTVGFFDMQSNMVIEIKK